jgi:mono/diheme cytochrome c family protein
MPGFARAAGGSLTDEQARIVSAGIKVHFRAAGNALSTNYPPYGVEKGDAQRGKEVFGRACAQCHGADGQGTKHAGAIHDAAFLALVSDQALRRIIITGRPDLQMPNYAESSGRPAGYQPLTSSEIDDLVALLAQWRRTPRAGSIASSRATIDD